MPKKLLWSVLLLVCFHLSHGKKIPLIHYTVENGLPSNNVYSVTSQPNGYFWFSTNKGLSRFNGISFQNFSTFDNLPDNDVFNVFQDNSERLWISSYSGYLCYYKDDTFHTAQNTPWLKLPFNSLILRNGPQDDGSVNIIFNNPTLFVNIIDNKVRVVPVRSIKGSAYEPLLDIKSLSKDTFKLIFSNHISIVTATGKLVSILPFKVRERHFLFMSHSSDIYAGTEHGIYDMEDRLLLPFKKTSVNLKNQIPGLVYKNNIFIGTLNGVSINDDIQIDLGERVTAIERDPEDNFWISTLGKGVYFLSKYFKELAEYNHVYNGKVIYAKILGNDLYFVTNDGSLYAKKGDDIKCILKHNKAESNSYFTKSNFLITDQGDFIKLIDDKIHVFNGINKNKTLKPFELSLEGTSVKEMFQNGKDIYLGMVYDIEKFNLDTFLKKPHNNFDTIVKDEHINRIFSRTIDAQDNAVWYSQKNKVYRIVGKQPILQTQFPNTTFRTLTFFNNYLIAITENNTLCIYNNYRSEKIHPKIISLPNCIWENIIPISKQCALISTNNYYRLLTLLPPDKNGDPQYNIETIESPFLPKLAEYVVSDSINSYFFKDSIITLIPNKVFFGKTKPPVPVFKSFATLKKKYAVRSTLEIPYDEAGAINIQIDNISFASKSPSVQYSISEDDKENWIDMSGSEINMSSPGFGKYIIKVRSKTISSSYSSPIVVTLIIDKPFWAKWWFITLVAIAVILLVYGIILFFSRRNLRKKQKEHEAEFKYQQSEYKALNALMNPHFIFNSLNNIQGLINKDDKDTANQYLVIFSHLIRQNMKNVSLGLISLEQEMHLVGNYLSLEKLRFKNLVNFDVKIDPEIEIDDIMIPPLLIQPLVENAILHGLLPKQSEDSIVHINLYEKEDIVYISIKDNGIGLTASLNRKHGGRDSYGLLNMNKRIEHLKKFQDQEINFSIHELTDENGIVLGTESIITIDLK